jgi:hypothetical protein
MAAGPSRSSRRTPRAAKKRIRFVSVWFTAAV